MATETLNLYGDRLSPTTGQHGSNISEQRVDELDQACLDFVKTRITQGLPCHSIDIGGGSGAQGKRMAKLGASVLFVDLTDQLQSVRAFNETLGREAIRFLQRDVRHIGDDEWPESINCVYSQRMLGCIHYHESLQLLLSLKSKAAKDAQFFLSTGGLDTEYGRDYPDRHKAVEERWACFSPEMAAKHGIHAPECLYRESDLRQLADQAGLAVLRSWTSAFGNPKLVASA